MTSPATPIQPTASRRLAAWLHARPRLQLGVLLAGPWIWMVVVYLGSLAILLLNAFWDQDAFSGQVIPFAWTLEAFETIFTVDVYRTIAIRTISVAVLVTLTDVALGFPIAYYMARVASPRRRRLLVVAVLMPLWASYLVKIYAWRAILQGNGLRARPH